MVGFDALPDGMTRLPGRLDERFGTGWRGQAGLQGVERELAGDLPAGGSAQPVGDREQRRGGEPRVLILLGAGAGAGGWDPLARGRGRGWGPVRPPWQVCGAQVADRVP